MSNSFNTFTRKIASKVMKGFESERNISKSVNTQLLDGKFNPNSGDSYDFKRPTDYTTTRTSDGNISTTRSDIVTAKATGTVQDYITVAVDFDEVDQALKMGDDLQDQYFSRMAKRICTDLELSFAQFVMQNSGLRYGTPGVAASTWDHIAGMGATLNAAGVPMDSPWTCHINPYTQTSLASNQRSLGAGGDAGKLVSRAVRTATVAEQFAGFDRVLAGTTLASYTNAAGSDRAGALTGVPTMTYAANKDSMTQTISVDSFTGSAVIPAGTQLTIAGVNQLNMSTRQPIIDATGSKVPWTGTVVESVTLSGGAGDIVVTGPMIYESGGAYNTVDAAPGGTAVVTLLGGETDIIQPNLFFHKDAFSIGSVPIKKLYSTDTVATTQDGLQMRVSKGSDWAGNSQSVRIDLHPAFAALNPYFAGLGHGVS